MGTQIGNVSSPDKAEVVMVNFGVIDIGRRLPGVQSKYSEMLIATRSTYL